MGGSSVTGLSSVQAERAAGVLLATAAGDALGAGYEFGPPLDADVEVVMAGGGTFGWQPGEWTDDTAMALAIAEVTVDGADLLTRHAQDRIAARWTSWAATAKDVGTQTRQVLRTASRTAAMRGQADPSAADLRAAATALHQQTAKTAGNGSLMRTAPVAIAYLHDPAALAEAAAEISVLTHPDPEAGEACILWCLAIRHAVLHGTFDGVQEALAYLPAAHRDLWATRLQEATTREPSTFTHNGWVVEALQAAWSAISRTAVPDEVPPHTFAADHLRLALEAAVRGGRDTDTVAAIAGGLLGARWGASAVPAHWRRRLHGWPDLQARDLIRLGWLTAHHGRPDGQGWPSGTRLDYDSWPNRGELACHPQDPQVWLSGIAHLTPLPDGVDAVVSLCRLGVDQVPAAGVDTADHVEVWLVDDERPEKNPNLDFVLNDAANAVAELRHEGHTVLLHCVQAQSRTPTVAAIYGARRSDRSSLNCLTDIQQVLPTASPNPAMLAALSRLGATVESISIKQADKSAQAAPASATAPALAVPDHQGAFSGEPRDPDYSYDLTLTCHPVAGLDGPWQVTGAILKHGHEPAAWVPDRRDSFWDTDDADGLLCYLEEKSGGNSYTNDSLWYWIKAPEDATALIDHYDQQIRSAGLGPPAATSKEIRHPMEPVNSPVAGRTFQDDAVGANTSEAPETPALRITRVGVPDWVRGASSADFGDDLGGQLEWHFATPWVFQALASPTTFRPILVAPGAEGLQEHRCAYWTSVLYLLIYRLGWADPAAGLTWWRQAGYPTDDPTLQLVAAVWLQDGRLPPLEAWLRDEPRPFGADFERRCGYRPSLRTPGNWETRNSAESDPLGPAQLHLEATAARNHLTTPFAGDSRMGTMFRSRAKARRAMLLTDSMLGWYGALIDHGAKLPELGARSWHVDIYSRPVGFLGTYRRSRETGIWFTGRHSIHRAGT